MKGTMKVAVMNGIGKMGYTTRPIPTPKEDEVLVKLEYVGICGSDMHYYETGAIGNYVVKPPFVLGHEPGGTVVEVGSAVKHLKVGDRVALEPGKTCGHCKFCRCLLYTSPCTIPASICSRAECQTCGRTGDHPESCRSSSGRSVR